MIMINLTESEYKQILRKLNIVEKYKYLTVNELRVLLIKRYENIIDFPKEIEIKFKDDNEELQSLNISTLFDCVRSFIDVVKGNAVTGVNPDIQINNSTYLSIVAAIESSKEFDMFFTTELKSIEEDRKKEREFPE